MYGRYQEVEERKDMQELRQRFEKVRAAKKLLKEQRQLLERQLCESKRELEEQRQRHSRQLCESKRELEEQRQLYDRQLCDSKRELRQQRESHEKQLHDAKRELAEQQSSSEHTQEKLNERLGFLGLQDPDPSREFLKGDVTFVVQGDGEDAIHAHRFILVRSLFDFLF
ncbi:hypothetical protein R1flu_004357 [Riccia fluitans]|uniref:BTB/POZ domain-containing protein n=1 Tax=Riccia fluitans TaxID=41844 RepID=A0ABD1YQC2_9MARC